MSMLRRVLDRESIVKTNLTESLVECVKELQLKYAAKRGGALKNDESTNSLCWILEAVFIHGLKNRFLKSMSSVLTSRENLVPEPSFWEFVLVFCHQEVILQILQLSLIHTDIGRCRAWLRVAINDGLFISYLQLMLGDKSTLKDYYKPSAFLRDSDRCDIMKSYLYGIESYDFQLAFNSSLLNTWNSGPLSLVGLWTPTDTITQGIDVAGNMDDKDLQALPQLHNQARTPPKPSFFSLENNANSFRVPLLEEDEALRVILSSRGSTGSHSASRSAASSRKNSDGASPLPFFNSGIIGTSVTVTVATTITVSSTNTSASNSPRAESTSVIIKHSEPLQILPTSSSACLESKMIDYVEMEHDDNLLTKVNMVPNHCEIQNYTTVDNSCTNVIKTCESDLLVIRNEENIFQVKRNLQVQIPTPEEELSYAALFDNYNTDAVIGSPVTGGSFFDISQFGSNKGHNLNSTTTSSDPALGSSIEENRSSSGTPIDSLGFEIVSTSDQFSEMLPPIDAYTQRVPREIGLDTQNYQCRSCERPIGMIYGAVRVCGFTGYYYCAECHVNDEFVIPSRILLNWDFNRYFVSKEAKNFLTELLDQPILHVQEINPKLYHHVEECAEVEQLRTKLQSISMYLRTCKEPILKEFQKDIWPKEYFYENIHLYSLADLLNIPNRTLAMNLTKLVTLGRNHINCCLFCKQKGFVCEVCRDSKIIFPFDLERIFKCSSCGAVYHNKCMYSGKSCPRCERWKISAYDADLTCL